MQNNVMSTGFAIPAFTGALQKSYSLRMPSTDDTFMSMLSERIAARNNRTVSAKKFEPLKATDDAAGNKGKEILGTERNAEVEASGSKTVKTKKTKAAEEAESSAVKEDRPEVETEAEIESLEAMIALLEELMARLEEILRSAGNDSDDTLTVEALPTESRQVSLMELLMALVEGKTEELKKLASELSEGINDPEVNELVEKIRDLIEKLSGEEKEIIVEFTEELDKAKEQTIPEVVEDLKSKCGQLIQKLREQVAKLKGSLPGETEDINVDRLIIGETGEETDETEIEIGIDGNEPKKQTESRDSENETKTEAAVQKPLSQAVVKDDEQNFDQLVIPNDQIPVKTVNEPSGAEKMPVILSKKPLEQSVADQVMMKVKLMAGENKQEMEMHLKPDSLGRLSLKIIHERGEILARITVENEQVKGILESNMQLLRDALEKNGFTVQSLNVSVGNDRRDNRTKEDSGPGGRIASGSAAGNGIKSSVIDANNLRERIEKEYYGQSSRINLTA